MRNCRFWIFVLAMMSFFHSAANEAPTIVTVASGSDRYERPRLNNNDEIVWSQWSEDEDRYTVWSDRRGQISHNSYSVDDHAPDINDAGEIIWRFGDGGQGPDGIESNFRGLIYYEQGGSLDPYYDTQRINNSGEIIWSRTLWPTGYRAEEIWSNERERLTFSPEYTTNRDTAINDSGEVVYGTSRAYSGPSVNSSDLVSTERGDITDDANSERDPDINNLGEVVWQQLPDGTGDEWEIWTNERGRISADAADSRSPSVNDNGEIVWQSRDGQDWEIVSSVRGQITDNNWDDLYPQVNNLGTIVWLSKSSNLSPGPAILAIYADGGTSVIPPNSETYGGVAFPAGASSFADRVGAYEPDFGGGPMPDVTQQDSRQILGVPEQGEMSLGDGGRITVRFLDNKLTGSGDSRPDLYVFEVGAPETTLVEIKKNTGPWYSVGTATGYASGIDIDAYGFGPSDWFTSVRLTDDGDGPDEGLTPGADLVAVGARSTIRSYSHERRLTYWIQAHVGGKSALLIRGNTLSWHHLTGTAPGLARTFHSFGSESNSPTIIDSNQGPNIEWVPSGWPRPIGNGTHPAFSVYFDALTPVFPEREWCWNLSERLGIGHVSIGQQPNEKNRYGLKIIFNDLGSGDKEHLSGSGFYSIELKTTGRGC